MTASALPVLSPVQRGRVLGHDAEYDRHRPLDERAQDYAEAQRLFAEHPVAYGAHKGLNSAVAAFMPAVSATLIGGSLVDAVVPMYLRRKASPNLDQAAVASARAYQLDNVRGQALANSAGDAHGLDQLLAQRIGTLTPDQLQGLLAEAEHVKSLGPEAVEHALNSAQRKFDQGIGGARAILDKGNWLSRIGIGKRLLGAGAIAALTGLSAGVSAGMRTRVEAERPLDEVRNRLLSQDVRGSLRATGAPYGALAEMAPLIPQVVLQQLAQRG